MTGVDSPDQITVQLARRDQVDQVIHLMLAGVSSDPTSIQEVVRSWWRRLLFTRSLGPRMFHREMDTFVALRGDRVVGYLIVRYEGQAAGTFDWGLADAPLDPQIFDALVNAALDHVEAQEDVHFFYLGLSQEHAQELTPVLEAIGFGRLDYQSFQMVGPLPLAAPEDHTHPEEQPSTRLRLAVQLPRHLGQELATLVPLDYPEETPQEDLEIVAELHRPTLSRSKLFQVAQGERTVGFVQQHQWKDELRLLLCLASELWGTPEERALVLHLSRLLGRRARRLRVRSFGQAHLEASRPSLESLGLTWEESPWQRWVVEFGEAPGGEGAEG